MRPISAQPPTLLPTTHLSLNKASFITAGGFAATRNDPMTVWDHATVIVDEEAAALLAEKDYYRWIFDNEPEWDEYR